MRLDRGRCRPASGIALREGASPSDGAPTMCSLRSQGWQRLRAAPQLVPQDRHQPSVALRLDSGRAFQALDQWFQRRLGLVLDLVRHYPMDCRWSAAAVQAARRRLNL